MRLILAKCAFGVAAGKFLGFKVHERGIKANLEKIKAILDLKLPTTLKHAVRYFICIGLITLQNSLYLY